MKICEKPRLGVAVGKGKQGGNKRLGKQKEKTHQTAEQGLSRFPAITPTLSSSRFSRTTRRITASGFKHCLGACVCVWGGGEGGEGGGKKRNRSVDSAVSRLSCVMQRRGFDPPLSFR